MSDNPMRIEAMDLWLRTKPNPIQKLIQLLERQRSDPLMAEFVPMTEAEIYMHTMIHDLHVAIFEVKRHVR